jgi:hypothetical protein
MKVGLFEQQEEQPQYNQKERLTTRHFQQESADTKVGGTISF